MIADADVLSADITRMQAVENFNKEQNRSTRPPRAGFGNDDKSEETVKNQKRAFTRVDAYRPGECRESGLHSDSGAARSWVSVQSLARSLAVAFLVPTGFDPTFHSALKSYGQLLDAVYTLNTASGWSD